MTTFEKSLKLLNKLFLKENLLISFCGSIFYLTGNRIIDESPANYVLASLIFWSTLLTYQVNTKVKINLADFSSFRKLNAIPLYQIWILVLLMIIIASHLIFLQFSTILYISHLALISTLYNVPENPVKNSFFPLRTIPVLKVFLIAYVWASISSILPILDIGSTISLRVILVFLAHFLFILAITLPFDIRDFRSDYKKHLITTPHVIGIRWTKIFALCSLLAFTCIFYILIMNWLILPFGLLVGYLIIISSPRRKDYFYTLFLDGTIILYFIIVDQTLILIN